MSDSDVCERAREACEKAAAKLRAASVPREALARYRAPRKRLLVFTQPATMIPEGEVWRLGTLLLSDAGELWAAGNVTRAAERGRVGYQSLSREDRKDLAAAALKGGYPQGSVVNFDARPLELTPAGLSEAPDSLPIGIDSGEVRVRWRKGAPLAGAPTLAEYLGERAKLLVQPPLSTP